ncbi:MAG: Flp pilus assembly complex ATPase component [bacterium]|nr:Flp pilus assembly complex ATPase component [bacterium]
MIDQLRERLLAEHAWKESELAAAEDEATRRKCSIGEVLASDGQLDPPELYRLVAQVYGLHLYDADELFEKLDAAVARSVPSRFQERKRVLPIARVADVLLVASPDPEPRVLDLIDSFDVERVELCLVTPVDFRRLRWAVELGQLSGLPCPDTRDQDVDLLGEDVLLEARHAAILDALLLDAAGSRASDIHLERHGDRVRLRLRIDGDLHDVDHYALTPSDALAIVNVLKVRARLDITERRLPQGGRTATQIGGQSFDLRVQILPSLDGEGVAIRLLPQDRELFSIRSLGWSTELEAIYRRTLQNPSGLVLVVGPTGCGKSTTLYAGLQHLAHQISRKVLTVEDPIEYRIENVHQTQVNAGIGYGFADSVRSFVRHDPDVIFVGEIRDTETALEALRASQTGHLVLSTLHASDSVDAVQRLYDLGMHPNSIAAELLAVFSQRLVKRICPNCREQESADPDLLSTVFPTTAPADLRLEHGTGCQHCRQRGSMGRIAVAEYLPTSRDLRVAISHHLPLDEIRTAATKAGLQPMRDHALELVSQGLIRFNDLPHSIPLEQLAPDSWD